MKCITHEIISELVCTPVPNARYTQLVLLRVALHKTGATHIRSRNIDRNQEISFLVPFYKKGCVYPLAADQSFLGYTLDFFHYNRSDLILVLYVQVVTCVYNAPSINLIPDATTVHQTIGETMLKRKLIM